MIEKGHLRAFSKTLILLLLCVASLASAAARIDKNMEDSKKQSDSAAGEELPRPNIIFFMCDDLSYGDLSCFGQKKFNTPAIDSLAKDGMVFTHAYAGGPWCGPSRTSLLTGLRPDHWSIRRTDDTSYPTLGTLLQKAGYATAAFGKWHMRDGAAKSQSLISQRGFDRVLSAFNTPGLRGDHRFHFPPEMMSDGKIITIEKNAKAKLSKEYLWLYNQEGAREKCFDEDGNFRDENGNTDLEYAEHIYREAALEFMRRKHDKPFFIYYNPPSPHGPLNVKSLGRFKDLENRDRGWNLARKCWAGMIEELDKSMEMFLAELEKQGIADNTLVIFTSDNGFSSWGYSLGRTDKGFKRVAWLDDPFFKHKGIPADRGKFINSNGGWQVPFVARWPKKMPAGESNRAISFYDMMATFAELAGVEVEWPTDGKSIVPLLTGNAKKQPARPSLFFPDKAASFTRWRDYEQDNPVDAVVLDEQYYAYSIVADAKTDNPTIRTFDLSVDPGCQKDLAKTHPELAVKLAKRALHVFRSE
ncbi:MAG TPA: sulfatase-like hydrolase/transferase [Sedimentisphaerales bacterium]|nr:sulfatase-like hydrolase/transferase [Sedimentisphaerales bacterium]